MLVTLYWWQFSGVGDGFSILVRSLRCWYLTLMLKVEDLVTKTAKLVINISKLSLTYFVSNTRHQHRCRIMIMTKLCHCSGKIAEMIARMNFPRNCHFDNGYFREKFLAYFGIFWHFFAFFVIFCHFLTFFIHFLVIFGHFLAFFLEFFGKIIRRKTNRIS